MINSRYQTVSHGGDGLGYSSYLQQYFLACNQLQIPYCDLGKFKISLRYENIKYILYILAPSGLSETNYHRNNLSWSVNALGQPILNDNSHRVYQYPSHPISNYTARQAALSSYFNYCSQSNLVASPHLTSSLPAITWKKYSQSN